MHRSTLHGPDRTTCSRSAAASSTCRRRPGLQRHGQGGLVLLLLVADVSLLVALVLLVGRDNLHESAKLVPEVGL